MENNDRHIEEILKYLGRKMTEEDRYAFERRMEADPFLMDAVEGYQGKSMEEVETELKVLHASLRNSKKARLVPVWMRVAAGLLLLVGATTLYMIHREAQKTHLVSDNIELQEEVKTEDSMLLKPASAPTQTKLARNEEELQTKPVGELKEASFSHKKTEGPEQEIPISTKALAKLDVVDTGLQPEVNMALRYEDSTVKAERALVGRLAGVDVSAVEGEGDREFRDIRIRGIASTYPDTVLASFRGRVVDEQGMPLPGVTVMYSKVGDAVSESLRNEGVVTDLEGNFEISAPKSGAVLELKYIGFKDKLAVVKDDSVGELVMQSQNLAMDEVVVTGYGSQKKKEVSGAAGRAKARLGSDSAVKDNMLLPEPEGGMKKLVKKMERSLTYPTIEKKMAVQVKVFVSSEGEVVKVDVDLSIDADFALKLKEKLKATKWIAPKINGMPIESSREVSFEFSGSK
ncbi:carboxypeptidase-like regulatory domain-containing protein [Saccharicrinis sp. GN24d3]|uniref:carboxypeptidase-like regulatory domain-containing protein n=1 Tax=Saccharicrinis sp. GN24d3 TaxID=3458416 RepID=UPI0040357768